MREWNGALKPCIGCLTCATGKIISEHKMKIFKKIWICHENIHWILPEFIRINMPRKLLCLILCSIALWILIIYSCGGVNTPALCAVTKGIKARLQPPRQKMYILVHFLTASFLQGKKLVSIWNHWHPCRITHTVRNIEHCAPTLASGLLIDSRSVW